jgi:acyl-CoA synthetase (AMP-forming)/AMP-acid ligase II
VSVTEDELRQFALANGPAYQHPRRVFFLEHLPLAGTNKIDRGLLRQWVSGGALEQRDDNTRTHA